MVRSIEDRLEPKIFLKKKGLQKTISEQADGAITLVTFGGGARNFSIAVKFQKIHVLENDSDITIFGNFPFQRYHKMIKVNSLRV